MTGWGQDGPYAAAAGHDINYISLAGARPSAGSEAVPPLNLVGDFGGGGMFLAFGIACGIVEAQRSRQGQVIDAAMVDEAASLMKAMTHSFRAMGIWNDERGTNMLDTGAHYYDVYETADGKYVSIGPIEPQFYAELLRLTGLEGEELPWQQDRSHWPELKERFAAIFRTKSRAEWCELMEGTDVCFAPVLGHPRGGRAPPQRGPGHLRRGRRHHPARPRPRFSRTPGESAGRRRTPASTPTRCCATPASTPTVAKLRRRRGGLTGVSRMRLDGQVAVVTGAGSGIGLAAARLFGAEGATVVAVDRDGTAAEAAAAEWVAWPSSATSPTPRLWDRVVGAAGAGRTWPTSTPACTATRGRSTSCPSTSTGARSTPTSAGWSWAPAPWCRPCGPPAEGRSS